MEEVDFIVLCALARLLGVDVGAETAVELTQDQFNRVKVDIADAIFASARRMEGEGNAAAPADYTIPVRAIYDRLRLDIADGGAIDEIRKGISDAAGLLATAKRVRDLRFARRQMIDALTGRVGSQEGQSPEASERPSVQEEKRVDYSALDLTLYRRLWTEMTEPNDEIRVRIQPVMYQRATRFSVPIGLGSRQRHLIFERVYIHGNSPVFELVDISDEPAEIVLTIFPADFVGRDGWEIPGKVVTAPNKGADTKGARTVSDFTD